jgi:hypothetical protein
MTRIAMSSATREIPQLLNCILRVHLADLRLQTAGCRVFFMGTFQGDWYFKVPNSGTDDGYLEP